MTPKKRVCKQKRPGRINKAFFIKESFQDIGLKGSATFMYF